MTSERRLLEVHDLALERGGETLLTGLDFQLSCGELLWLRGPNGRGKTSLLRVLAGLAAPESGTIAWDASARPLYLAHANALKEDFTAGEALAFLARVHGGDGGDGAVRSALQCLGLPTARDRFVRTLSQGQRRRVALARLLLQRDARAWLLDEPFDALDAPGLELAGGLIAGHLATGGGVLLTSHIAPRVAGVVARELALPELVA